MARSPIMLYKMLDAVSVILSLAILIDTIRACDRQKDTHARTHPTSYAALAWRRAVKTAGAFPLRGQYSSTCPASRPLSVRRRYQRPSGRPPQPLAPALRRRPDLPVASRPCPVIRVSRLWPAGTRPPDRQLGYHGVSESEVKFRLSASPQFQRPVGVRYTKTCILSSHLSIQ